MGTCSGKDSDEEIRRHLSWSSGGDGPPRLGVQGPSAPGAPRPHVRLGHGLEAQGSEGPLILDAMVVNGTGANGTSFRRKADVDEQEAKRLELEIAVTALEQNIAELEEEIQLAKAEKARKAARSRARAEMPEPPRERSELLRPHLGTDSDRLDSLESLREQMARAREEELLTTDENRLRELSRTISELQDWILRLEGPRGQKPESELVKESRES
ncbi:unnamed protein product [Prorocentrum cordatum]|uniref:Uncharacterized protein n=1 Tax=Prorocentrum cordatum TaxID=2364126 RepID=A0ABN9VSV2_9DINO|nr:unnamed protein product [Polarella glacialis]